MADDFVSRFTSELLSRIEAGTRLRAKDVSIAVEQSGTASYRLLGTHDLAIYSQSNTAGGRANPDSCDIVVTSEEQFNAGRTQIVTEYRESSARHEDLKALLAGKGGRGYNLLPHNQKRHVLRYKRRVLREYACHCGNGRTPCVACLMQGKVRCSSCNGHGNLTCRSCNGNGIYECGSCEGRGKVSRFVTYKTSYGSADHGYVYETCVWCRGSGESTCSSCRGAGKFRCSTCNSTGQTTCESCEGKASLECSECKGVGRLLTVGTTDMQVHSTYRVEGIGSPSPEWVTRTFNGYLTQTGLDGRAHVEYQTSSVHSDKEQAVSEFHAHVPYAVLTVSVGPKRHTLRMIGTTPELFGGEALFQEALTDDLDMIKGAVTGLGRFNPFYRTRAARAINRFMASGINAAIAAPDPKSAHLLKHVESAYQNEAREALNQLYQRVGTLSWLRNVALTLTLMPLFFYIAVWFGAINKPLPLYNGDRSYPLVHPGNEFTWLVTALVGAWGLVWLYRWRRTQWAESVAGGRLKSSILAAQAGAWGLGHLLLALMVSFGTYSRTPVWVDSAGLVQGKYAVPGIRVPQPMPSHKPAVQGLQSPSKALHSKVKAHQH